MSATHAPADGRPRSQPITLRVLNGVGRALRAAGVPVIRLDADSLMARARKRCGLSDFGDDGFREPLNRLVHAYDHEAALTTLGRIIARTDAVRLLENRLHFADTFRRHPEIQRGAVAAPIFIVGLPRTGTTILHELLAQDPANRVPMTWEVMHPHPPPERATYDTDARIALVDGHFSGVERLLPGFHAIHPMGAQLPQECVALMAHDFASMIYHTANNVPSYQRWLEQADMTRFYASHKRQLQYLQWKCPGDRWVLKSPAHLWALDALLTVYPDARIVHTHRDPLKVIASLTHLVTILRSMATDRIDAQEIALDWTQRLARGLEATMEARARHQLPAERIFDMHFNAFVADEIAMVRRIYDHFHLDVSPAAEERMRRYLDTHRQDTRGVHRYTLAATGLNVGAERARYRAYIEHYGIQEEAAA